MMPPTPVATAGVWNESSTFFKNTATSAIKWLGTHDMSKHTCNKLPNETDNAPSKFLLVSPAPMLKHDSPLLHQVTRLLKKALSFTPLPANNILYNRFPKLLASEAFRVWWR